MILLRAPFSYTRVEEEDPDELRHRRAQYLIYKVLEEAESLSRQYYSRRRVFKVRVKIGSRLKRLRLAIQGVKLFVRRRITKHFKHPNNVLHGKESLP
ncbi:hypothetical protein ACMD2_11469 [Ananas comosus]|uniref:Uncharacterized protein n=1 Tax=Ananas comosus TaxID=4615 RepID=A0A199VUY6_ANACO|nr:hypothetical protein ACMD2_11469 [Ananas comosus]